MARGSAGAVLKYGKIEMYGGEGESLADLMKHLTSLLALEGYPEADPIELEPVNETLDLSEDEPGEAEETQEDVVGEQTKSDLSPWEKLLKNKTTDGTKNE